MTGQQTLPSHVAILVPSVRKAADHLAIDVLNLESYIESLAGSGWLLHPISIKTMKQSQTVYLARPGFPGLIEVQERKEPIGRSGILLGGTWQEPEAFPSDDQSIPVLQPPSPPAIFCAAIQPPVQAF